MVHCGAVVAVIIAGCVFHIDRIEWLIISLNIAVVLGFEMLNTAVEKICNLVHPQHHPFVKIIKDVAAGAVLVAAIAAAVCGAVIFIPKIF
jgi:diacylglycerol kinase